MSVAACASGADEQTAAANGLASPGVATHWEPDGGGHPPPDDDADDSTGCICEPGEALGCASVEAREVCSDDCQHVDVVACVPGDQCEQGWCETVDCQPGDTICDDDGAVLTCDASGAAYTDPLPCGGSLTCAAGMCLSACDAASQLHQSAGCSFFAMKMDNFFAVGDDGIVVANPSPDQAAVIQLWRGHGAGEVAQGDAIHLAPGQTQTVRLLAEELNARSAHAVDYAFRLSATAPVQAHLHSRLSATATNDSSLLLPESQLGQEYIVASYPGTDNYAGHLSYFDVVAIADGTVVTWTAPVDSLAGDGVAAVPAGATGSVVLDRHDTLQVAAAFGQDLTGAIVQSSAPVAVLGASACAGVPVNADTCDHIQEQMLPVSTWGTHYVAARAPVRDDEQFHWRIVSGSDGVSVTTSPDELGGVVALDRGEWIELTTDDNFVVDADGPVLVLQYLASHSDGAGMGDPAMLQLVPVEQFVEHYLVVADASYRDHYVQIVRHADGQDVTIDGLVVDGYTSVGAYEIADVPVAQGTHAIDSDAPFGLFEYGYNPYCSYAASVGMRLTPQ